MNPHPQSAGPEALVTHTTADHASEGWNPDDTFACPRCGRPVNEPYYGPCESCRTTLRMSITSDARDVDDVSYEPKMNVTPNAVALKD